MRRLLVSAGALFPLGAHADVLDGPATVAGLLWRIPVQPAAWFVIAALALMGWRGLRTMHEARRRTRAVAFGLALGVLSAAIASPLDSLASALFSMHMLQHLLLMLVVAPLLVVARVEGLVLRALPARARRLASRLRRAPPVRAARKLLLHPVSAGLVGAAVVWSWHAPALYERALRSDAVHALEHAAFAGSAILYWKIILPAGRRGQAGPGAAFFLVFLTALQTGLLGALLFLAPAVWYPGHTHTVDGWPLQPLEDQQLAGLLMWIPPGALHLATALTLVGRAMSRQTPPSVEEVP